MKILATAQVKIVSLQIRRSWLLDSLLLAFAEDDAQRFDYCLRDVVLDCEYVLHLAVVTLRPQMVAIGDIHELRCNPQSVAHLSHASFEYCGYLELATDIADVLVPPFERES